MPRVLLLLFFALPALANAVDEIAPYTARYEVQYNGFKVGEMTQRLSRARAGLNELETIAYTTGPLAWLKEDRVEEHSTWRDDGDAKRPISYRYDYTGRSDAVEERLDFDWHKGVVSSLHEGKRQRLALAPDTLDKHMYQIVLRQQLRDRPPHLTFTVADRGKLREYDFSLLGEETLQSPVLGRINTLKVQRGNTIIWAAPQYDYLPVKLENVEDGTRISTQLVAFHGN